MKKIKKNLGQPKNGPAKLHFETDKELVATTGASYCVKYLGYEEVKEARGVRVCSSAVGSLLKDKKNKKKVSLKISLDGVRVVDDISRVLVLDQPIEKISFCAPDSANPKLFSYIARDGASRRWLCYGFYAVEDPGERLSHALGCAFTACLQRKQKSAKLHEGTNSSSSSKSASSVEGSPAPAPHSSTSDNTVTTEPGPGSSRPIPTAAPSSSRPTPSYRPPMVKANTSMGITTIKRPPSKEVTVPLPLNGRGRSATTIGISTPPQRSAVRQRTDHRNPFGDNFGTEKASFTADIADILLFDPTDTDTMGQRRRTATEHVSNDTSFLDEFDPLHPTYKTMQFDDDFKPPDPFADSYGESQTFSHFSTTNPFLTAVSEEKTGAVNDEFEAFASSRITSQR